MHPRSTRLVIVAALFIAALTPAWARPDGGGPAARVAAQEEIPPWARRGLPGPNHAALQPLAGTWRVQMSLYTLIGTPEQPAVSNDLLCRREWVAGDRYLQDVTQGTIGGETYWRLGLLGYSTMDQRYEWVTIDRVNTMLMIYLGAPNSGQRRPISMSGTFTDQGVLGEDTVGQPVGMRTVITIESDDRHLIDLYFTPPGGEEFLLDRKVYTRVTG